MVVYSRVRRLVAARVAIVMGSEGRPQVGREKLTLYGW